MTVLQQDVLILTSLSVVSLMVGLGMVLWLEKKTYKKRCHELRMLAAEMRDRTEEEKHRWLLERKFGLEEVAIIEGEWAMKKLVGIKRV